MEMTRRQFAVSLAAASYLGPALFEPSLPSEFRAASFRAESPGRMIQRL
jgi:hypothetical protein